jgi:ABC-type lipoprotein release transport system permease subunit
VLACLGMVLGLVLSFFAGRSLGTLLAGVGPFDILTVAVSCVLALTLTLSGSLLPALRAMRSDPTSVIRGQ